MIRYQLTEQEVVRGLLKYRRAGARLWVRISIGVFGLLMLVYSQQLRHSQREMPFVMGCAFIGASVALIILAPWLIRRAYTNLVRNNPVLTDTIEVSFAENGITFSTATRKSELAWIAFKRLTEDEQYFYLHSDNLGNVTLLPKRAFDATSVEDFRHFSQTVPAT